MKKIHTLLVTLAAIIGVSIPVLANAASVSIQSLTPSATVTAKTQVTFRAVPVGYTGQPIYTISDSFSGTTITSSNINFGGNFSWVPVISDVGTHTITIGATDTDGNSGSATQTITVLPPPTISIQGITPGSAFLPGSTVSFTIVQNGFNNPTYTPSDSFSGSSVNGSATISNGVFMWKPDASQNGEHTITVYATDGSGYNAQASVSFRVGAGPSLAFPPSFTPNVTPGNPITFTMIPNGYAPTGFSVFDTFPGTTLSSNNISTTGAFAWSPQVSDIGSHTVTIIGQVGAYGASASTTQVINVLGPNGYLPPPPVATTTTSTSAGSAPSLSDLQKQLLALQAQALTASTPAKSVTAGFQFTLALKQGSENNEVMELQKILQKEGYLSVAPNAYFGPSTFAAVKKFQAANGLQQLGTVGPGTRAALNARSGGRSVVTTPAQSGTRFVFNNFMGVGDDDATQVSELQKRLKELGFFSDAVSGYYGANTEAAVKKFQTANGIAPSGYVASITRVALNK
jgi:peptidoglycan hydrolase-like protein with peptidoglycan-binding domain